LLPYAQNDSPIQKYTASAPQTEDAAKRVIAVGQSVINANPKIGVRPMFVTVGSVEPEIFHRGGELDSLQVVVSEGLVRACASDDELAGVLCLQMAKAVHEQHRRGGLIAPDRSDRANKPEPIGNEIGGTFGAADGSRVMELARMEKQRKTQAKVPLASRDVLAQRWLTKAGYQGEALTASRSILSKAEKTFVVEKAMKEER
jgi:hypothetical protein